MNDPGKVVILGAGPTGLGAAYRLSELGFDTFTVVEERPIAGGLAASEMDQHGFTWDIGGHVQFSHYDYYDAVLNRALGNAWLEHERQSWVWVSGSWVPYPFQYNLHRLPPDDRDRALRGLERRRRVTPSRRRKTSAAGSTAPLARASPRSSCDRTTTRCGVTRWRRSVWTGSESVWRCLTWSGCVGTSAKAVTISRGGPTIAFVTRAKAARAPPGRTSRGS